MVKLAEQLAKTTADLGSKMPAAAMAVIQKGMEEIQSLGLEEKAIKQGDTIPEFSLKNARNESVSIKDLLAKGPVVITFYRGHWCPLCTLELQAFQSVLPEIESLGGQLVAISPNLPDKSLTTIEQENLKFEVLSDIGNNVARQCGLVFTLPEPIKKIYKDFGIDLAASNGDNTFELPVPATYVVGSDGIIKYSYINSNYTNRAEPDDIIKVLKELQAVKK